MEILMINGFYIVMFLYIDTLCDPKKNFKFFLKNYQASYEKNSLTGQQ